MVCCIIAFALGPRSALNYDFGNRILRNPIPSFPETVCFYCDVVTVPVKNVYIGEHFDQLSLIIVTVKNDVEEPTIVAEIIHSTIKKDFPGIPISFQVEFKD